MAMDADSTVCYCLRVSRRKVIEFLKRERPQEASRISECLGAGTGCGWCVPFLKELHRKVMSGEIAEADELSDAEYERMREEYLDDLRVKKVWPPKEGEPAGGLD